MTNIEIAEVFDRIASLLEIKGDLVYKIVAYRRAAETFRSSSEEIQKMVNEDRLGALPGVGKAIAEKTAELLSTGQISYLEKLQSEIPVSLVELLEVPDLGPKKVLLLWQQAGISDLDSLERAARSGQLRSLSGIGEKTELRLLEGIKALRRKNPRVDIDRALPIAAEWQNWLTELPGVQRVETAGSIRRWRSTIGDLDFVAASNDPQLVMNAFTQRSSVKRVLAKGEYKSSVEIDNGFHIQLWVQPLERFGSLLQFVSGSKAHNVRLRELAQRRGLSLSERGFISGDGEILCQEEADVYSTLGLPWIPPELREDRGEIQAALTNHLPRLVEVSDLRADLHTHSNWSDGRNSILEMAQAAQRRGLAVYAVTDHCHNPYISFGLRSETVSIQHAEIEMAQQQIGDSLRLLKGCEVDIMPDGSLAISDQTLEKMDIVVASLHFELDQPREVITERLLKAVRNPHVDIIAHPAGRARPHPGADLDWPLVFTEAKKYGVALEINSNPEHFDMDEMHAREAAERGILLCINTDSHAAHQVERSFYGAAIARRAWVHPDQIISTWPAERLLDWLSARGK